MVRGVSTATADVDSEALPGDFRPGLENVTVPSYAVERTGSIRWLDPAAIELLGDCAGVALLGTVQRECSTSPRCRSNMLSLAPASWPAASGSTPRSERPTHRR